MSDGNKKPGLRDISDLKARLGMLNTGGGPGAPAGPKPPGAAPSNPFAPKAPAAPAAPQAPAAPAMPAAPAAPAVPSMPMAPAAPAAPAGPAAPAAPGLSVGGDLFKKPPPRQATAATPAAPRAQARQDQAQLEAMFEAPSRQVLDEAPKPEAEFANPLQQGAYAQAAAPVDLSADEEAALSSYEHKQAGMKPALAIGMTVGVGVLMLLIGYAIGDSIRARRFINAQIEASVRAQDQLQDAMNNYEKVLPLIAAMKEDTVEWQKVEGLPDLEMVAGNIFATPVPLHPDLAPRLSQFIVDANALFLEINEHKRITTKRDKAELQAMEEGSSFLQRKSFGVLYDPVDPEAGGVYIPPVGKVIAITGKPFEKEVEKKVGRRTETVVEYFVPIIDRQGKESEVTLRRLLRIDQDQFLSAGEANPLSLYSKRVSDLKNRLKAMDGYFDAFKDTLKAQAEREKVFAL